MSRGVQRSTSQGIQDIQTKLYDLHWREFEEFVADLWTLEGWTTKVTGGSDRYGEDVKAERSIPFEMEILIQAKAKGRGKKVRKPAIDKAALPPNSKFDLMVVVTSGTFTNEAIEASKFRNTKLVNGKKLATFTRRLDAEELLEDYIKSEKPTQPDVREYMPNNSLLRSVEEIKGIGSEYSKQLAQEDVHTVSKLANLDKTDISDLSDEINSSKEQLEKWVREAAYLEGKHEKVRSLMSNGENLPEHIQGIGSKFSDRLAEADIYTVADLAVADPEVVEARVDLTASQVQKWSQQARYQSK